MEFTLFTLLLGIVLCFPLCATAWPSCQVTSQQSANSFPGLKCTIGKDCSSFRTRNQDGGKLLLLSVQSVSKDIDGVVEPGFEIKLQLQLYKDANAPGITIKLDFERTGRSPTCRVVTVHDIQFLNPISPQNLTLLIELGPMPSRKQFSIASTFSNMTLKTQANSGQRIFKSPKDWKTSVTTRVKQQEDKIFVESEFTSAPSYFQDYNIPNPIRQYKVRLCVVKEHRHYPRCADVRKEKIIKGNHTQMEITQAGTYRIQVQPYNEGMCNCGAGLISGYCYTCVFSYSRKFKTSESFGATTVEQKHAVYLMLPSTQVVTTNEDDLSLYYSGAAEQTAAAAAVTTTTTTTTNLSDNRTVLTIGVMIFSILAIMGIVNYILYRRYIQRTLLRKQRKTSVLIIYAEDNPDHSNVIFRFVTFLQRFCFCDVTYLPLNKEQKDQWSKILSSSDSKTRIVFANSKSAFDVYMASQQSSDSQKFTKRFEHERKPRPANDKSLQKGILSISFEYTKPSFEVKDNVISRHFNIPKDFKAFMFHLHESELITDEYLNQLHVRREYKLMKSYIQTRTLKLKACNAKQLGNFYIDANECYSLFEKVDHVSESLHIHAHDGTNTFDYEQNKLENECDLVSQTVTTLRDDHIDFYSPEPTVLEDITSLSQEKAMVNINKMYELRTQMQLKSYRKVHELDGHNDLDWKKVRNNENKSGSNELVHASKVGCTKNVALFSKGNYDCIKDNENKYITDRVLGDYWNRNEKSRKLETIAAKRYDIANLEFCDIDSISGISI